MFKFLMLILLPTSVYASELKQLSAPDCTYYSQYKNSSYASSLGAKVNSANLAVLGTNIPNHKISGIGEPLPLVDDSEMYIGVPEKFESDQLIVASADSELLFNYNLKMRQKSISGALKLSWEKVSSKYSDYYYDVSTSIALIYDEGELNRSKVSIAWKISNKGNTLLAISQLLSAQKW